MIQGNQLIKRPGQITAMGNRFSWVGHGVYTILGNDNTHPEQRITS